MELQIFRDTLSAAGSFCTVKSEIPIETEILISDYLPQVFKIVKCFAKMIVLQKQLQTGRLNLEGYLRCTVYYQGENDQGLCQTEQKLPFSKSIDLPALDYSTYSAVVGGETEYLNCRAVNQRRVEVRGAYEISAGIYPQLQQEVITSIAECGSEQKQIPVSGIRCVSAVDKLITSDAEFHFDQPLSAVLDISATSSIREMRILSGKAVVKGEIQAEIVYRSEGSTALRGQRIPVSFQHIMDVDGITEDCSCFCIAEAVGFTVTEEKDETIGNRLSASAILHFRAYREQNLMLSADVFSVEYETEVEHTTVMVEQMEKQLDETVNLSASGSLPDENARLLACFASFGMPELTQNGDAASIRAHGNVTVFCENALNEIESYEKPVEFLFPLSEHYAPEELHVECWLTVQDISCAINNGVLDAGISVRAEGVVLKRCSCKGISGVTLGQLHTPADPEIALRIYYAQSGEELFEIARRFHVSPRDLRTANGLDAEFLTSACRLLVPGVG